MLSTAAQGRFAAEFATFLVAVAGLALVGLRAELLSRSRWARAALVVGFAAVGTAAFLLGSLLVADPSSPGTALALGAGLAAIAAGTLRWAGGRTSQRLLVAGVAVMAVSVVLQQGGAGNAADGVLGAGAVAVGVALLAASRRSVAARVAASAAGTLLVVVLVLSVALSAVLVRNTEDAVTHRIDVQAAGEASVIENAGLTTAVLVARSASLVLSGSAEGARQVQLLTTSPRPQPSAALSTILGYLRDNLVQQVSLLYVNQAGQILGLSQTGQLNQATVTGVVGSKPVQQAIGSGPISHGSERGSVEVIGNAAVAIGVEPVAITDATTHLLVFPGVLVTVQPLDDAYLAARAKLAKIGVALVGQNAVLAQAGADVRRATLLPLAAEALDGASPPPPRRVGDRFFSAQTVVAGDNRPVMALVASTPTLEVVHTRDSLFRTLFEIALGGTLIALLLAAVVGERIGSGLRTLTEAAQRIQRGEFAGPAGVRSDDEVGVLGLAFDSMAAAISEQTAALQQAAHDETALRNQLEAVVAGMGEAMVAADAAGHVTLVNRAAEELLEIDAASAVGRPVEDVIVATPDDGSNLAARLRRPSPSRWTTQATLIPDRLAPIPVAISAGALRGQDGGVAGAVFIVRDLRPERQVERMKSEFLSRIGHELRTPLTTIRGYANMLVRRNLPEARTRQFAQEIDEAGKRLGRIVEMLEFSAAAEAGRSRMRPERTSVRALVDGVVAGWEDRLNGNHVLARRVARGLPEIVADRHWLALSLDELIDNAVKFSPDGGRIGVTASAVSDGDGQAVEISVIDQGLGLSDAEREEVFADFAQGDTSDTRRFGGLGLGLSLVRRVAEAHGGRVTVTSTPRKGSKFSIVLPV